MGEAPPVSMGAYSIAFCLVCLSVLAAIPAVADVRLAHVDVFTDNTEGYRQFRIPSIARTADGTLHAFAEGRLTSTGDPGSTHIDLVYKRSTDGGHTWTPLSILDRHPDTTYSGGVPNNKTSAANSVAVLDRSNNRLWVFNLRLPSGLPSASSSPIVDDLQTWARYTDDNGQTWSTAQRITVPQYTDIYPNLGSGIQMADGRLVVPATARTFDGTTTRSFALTSIDHGTTWQAGALISTPTNEQQVVQLANGTLFSSSRQNGGGNRIFRTSNNGGDTWQTTSTSLAMTQVAAGLERYTLHGVDGATEDRMLFSLPEGGVFGARSRLSIRSSTDEAATFPHGSSRLVYHGPAAYSDMQRLPGSEVGVLWERGPGTNQPNAGNKSITYTIFNDEFLIPARATGLIASESFEYSGATVGWANGANGWNSAWANAGTGSGALNSESQAGLLSGGLDHSGVSYELGGTASVQGQTLARGLGLPLDLSVDETYYFSTLVRRESTSAGSQFLDLLLLDDAGATHASLGAGTGGHWFITAPGDTQNTPPNAVANGTTYLLVGKLTASDTGFDQLFLKVFPDGEAIPTNDTGLNWTLTGATNENSSALIDRLVVSAGGSAQWLVDELRFGRDWSSVTSAQPAIDGDFNNDGLYNCDDINALTTAAATGGAVSDFDLNGDGSLSLADVDSWRAEAGGVNIGLGRVYTVGDANLDQATDGSDFNIWNSNKFTSNTNWCSGNFNADTVVDGSDFNRWNGAKFTSADAAMVPEPRVLWALALGIPVWLRTRCRAGSVGECPWSKLSRCHRVTRRKSR